MCRMLSPQYCVNVVKDEASVDASTDEDEERKLQRA